MARNAFQYAGGGRVEFLVESGTRPALVIRIRERGPGICDLQAILDGRYLSSTDVGCGIIGAKRLMDRFNVESVHGAGATVSMVKELPRRSGPPGPQELARISAELAKNAPRGLLEELQQQNQELLNTLQELRDHQTELALMHTRELDETNRGVVALYAELDENTNALKRLSDLKSRFLSEMSHEFRSPLNSISSLTGFLLARSDGDLSAEQEKQVRLIRKAAEGLSSLVDDLLDLAKVEAGKATIRVAVFHVREVFESLQGTIRPMVDPSVVRLVFMEPPGLLPLQSDEVKLTQILRNFLSNAVKFTERGEIRVSARSEPGETILFSVTDTGIGIAAEDLPRIFEEFGQIENPLQVRCKGTGLGLPLARKLAELLGGSVSVQSKPGVGSTFSIAVPRVFPRPDAGPNLDGFSASKAVPQGYSKSRALIVDDQEEDRYVMKGLLEVCGQFEILEAGSGDEAVRRARDDRPQVIVLDLGLPDISGFQVLDQLHSDDRTRNIPVIISTSSTLDASERQLLANRGISVLDKAIGSRPEALSRLRCSLEKAGLNPSSATDEEP